MADTNEEVQLTLQGLWDPEQIWQRLNRYDRGVDCFDRGISLSAFHADVIDEHGKIVGTPPEFVEWASGQHAHLIHQHGLMNHTCEFDGNTADAEAYAVAAVHDGPALTLPPVASQRGFPRLKCLRPGPQQYRASLA